MAQTTINNTLNEPHSPRLEFMIRRACQNDVPFLVKSLVQADQLPIPQSLSYWERILSNTSVGNIMTDCLSFVFQKKNSSYCSTDGWIVAEQTDGTLLGAACFCADGARSWEECDAAIRECATARHGMPVAELDKKLAEANIVDTILPETHSEDTWALEYIATAPEARGKGVATALVLAGLWLGYAHHPEHSLRAHSIVYVGNMASRSMQEKLGFTIGTTLTNDDFLATYGVRGAWIMELGDLPRLVRERLGGLPEPHMCEALIGEGKLH